MAQEQEKSNDLYRQVQRRLIASLLYDASSVTRVLELVAPEDFEEPALELIFGGILSLARRNEVVSPVSIAQELESTGNLQKAGGPAELYLLKEDGSRFIMEAPPELYAKMVKEASAKSKITGMLTDHKDLFKNDSGVSAADGVSGLQSALNGELYKLSDESTSSTLHRDFAAYLDLVKLRQEVAAANTGASEGLQGIPSLLPSINHYTTGWLPGQLITIGARTGVGKSVFAVNSAVAAAQAGKSVLFFSLEMADSELKDRIVSSTTGILLSRLRQGNLDERDHETLAASVPLMETMKIKIETEAKMSVDTIRAKCLRQAQSDDGLDFVVLDYLQLVQPGSAYSSRQEAVADISRNMKLLAKQLEVPVMVLVQVNREGKEDENPLPKLHQIRESGAIAQDSDIVILLHREETMDDTIPHTLVLLEKNRNGEAQKTVRCHSNLECSLFREVVRSKDVERMSEEDQAAALDDFDDGLSELFGDSDDLDLNDEELF